MLSLPQYRGLPSRCQLPSFSPLRICITRWRVHRGRSNDSATGSSRARRRSRGVTTMVGMSRIAADTGIFARWAGFCS